ncbi:hypothetical protein TWF694_005464 [Orbilia ellipsospora]|uniref:BTB domain-containing protein n=1 Tax=Orbilia ellipsospora TaxID=2528407 RepID=A0AAV9WT92_9PEZI
MGQLTPSYTPNGKSGPSGPMEDVPPAAALRGSPVTLSPDKRGGHDAHDPAVAFERLQLSQLTKDNSIVIFTGGSDAPLRHYIVPRGMYCAQSRYFEQAYRDEIPETNQGFFYFPTLLDFDKVNVAIQTGVFDLDDIYDLYHTANQLQMDNFMAQICERTCPKISLNVEQIRDFERLLDQATRLMEEYGHRRKVSAAYLGIIYEVSHIHEWYTIRQVFKAKSQGMTDKLEALGRLVTKYGICNSMDCVGCIKRRLHHREDAFLKLKTELLRHQAWENTWHSLGQTKPYFLYPPDPHVFD